MQDNQKTNLDLKTGEPQPAFDEWSPVHGASGFAMGLARFPRPIAYGLILTVEIIEFILRPTSEFFQESRKNIMADLVIGAVAFEAGRLIVGDAGLPRP